MVCPKMGTEGMDINMKRIRGKMLSLLLSVALIVGSLQGLGVSAVHAASTVDVRIGMTQLVDGTYYTAISGEDMPQALVKAVNGAPADGTPYLYYKDDVLTVTGNVQLNSLGPSALSVSGGAITLAGAGSLSLTGYGAPLVSVAQPTDGLILSENVNVSVTQFAPVPAVLGGSLQTKEGYAGNVHITTNQSSAFTSMNTIDIQTTGAVDIMGGGSSPVITCENAINIKGKAVKLQSTTGGSLLRSGFSTVSVNATGSDLSLKGDTDAPVIWAEGGVTLSGGGNIEVENTSVFNGTAVYGNLTVTQANNVRIQSAKGIAVNGYADITATGDVNISTGGTCPALIGAPDSDTKIIAKSIRITGKGMVPLLCTDTLSLHAVGNILIQRTEDAGSPAPLIIANGSQSLLSDTGLVIVSSGAGTTITTKEGAVLSAVYGGDVTSTGLDMYGVKGEKTPTQDTLYLAGNGYLLFQSAKAGQSAALLMNNASMEVESESVDVLSLPEGALAIELSGTNKITGRSTGAQHPAFGISTGDKYTSSDLTINSMNGGSLTIAASVVSDGFVASGIGSLDDNIHTLAITGNASVAVSSSIQGSAADMAQAYGAIIAGNLTVGEHAGLAAKGDTCDILTYTGNVDAKKFDGTVGFANMAEFQYGFTVYGAHDLPGIFRDFSVGTIPMGGKINGVVDLNIPAGSALTIPVDRTLTIKELSHLHKQGILINNGIIMLPADTTPLQIKDMNLTGTGVVRVAKLGAVNAYNTYTNSGIVLNTVVGNLDLANTEIPASADCGYTWTKSGEGSAEVWTLMLDHTYISGNLNLPDQNIVIKTTEDAVISGTLTPGSSYPCHLTLSGAGSLTVNGGISNAQGGELTVTEGIRVTSNRSVFIGSSGGANGIVNVTGTGTSLNVVSPYGYGVFTDTLNVRDNASLTTSVQGNGSTGVRALSGVNVTGGASITAGCDYGVYIIGGKLVVDADSRLNTNGSVAPFCIVDKSGVKAQNEVLSLPAIPDGTQVAFVKGINTGYGSYGYWSLIPTGGSLGVSQENSEPVSLSGAVVKALSFFKAQTPVQPVQPTQPGPSGSINDATKAATSGTVSKGMQSATDTLIVSLNNTTEELKTKVFSTGEQNLIKAGKNAYVSLSGMQVTVGKSDRDLAQKKFGGQKPDLYFDLSLRTQVGDGAQTCIKDTDGKNLNISVTLPKALWKTDVNYTLVSLEDGTAKMVEGSYDPVTHKFTFETDHIATFALGHTDQAALGSMRLVAKAAKTSQVLRFTKVAGADGYLIYGAQSGSDGKMSRLADVSGKTTRYTVRNLKQATSYQYQVKAYRISNGKKEIIAVSKVISSNTLGKAGRK